MKRYLAPIPRPMLQRGAGAALPQAQRLTRRTRAQRGLVPGRSTGKMVVELACWLMFLL